MLHHRRRKRGGGAGGAAPPNNLRGGGNICETGKTHKCAKLKGKINNKCNFNLI